MVEVEVEVACGPLEPLGYEMDVLYFLGPYPSRCRHDHDLGRIHAVQCKMQMDSSGQYTGQDDAGGSTFGCIDEWLTRRSETEELIMMGDDRPCLRVTLCQ